MEHYNGSYIELRKAQRLVRTARVYFWATVIALALAITALVAIHNSVEKMLDVVLPEAHAATTTPETKSQSKPRVDARSTAKTEARATATS